MDEGKTLFRTVGIDKWGKIIAHKGKGYQMDYTGWESMDMKVFPRRKGDPTEEWPISRNPENLKYTEDSQGVLEFPKPPKVSESGTSIDFTVEVTEKKDKLGLLMPKLKAREAIYHMNMEVELDLKLKASGATVSLDTMRAAMQQAIGATVPGPMAGIARSFISPKVRDKCNFYVQFPPPYIWHPFLQDDKLSQPNANQPSRNDPKYLASQDQERGAYILDTTTDEWRTCAAEIRKFNPDNQLYRVTDEVMDFNFNTIAHQDILQTDGTRDPCGFALKTRRGILGRPSEPNEMACKVVMKRKKEFSQFPDSPARNDGEECAVFYKWIESVYIEFVLHYKDQEGREIELFRAGMEIRHEQFEIGFKISNLDEDQTLILDWKMVHPNSRFLNDRKENGELYFSTNKDGETLKCEGEQIWKTKIKLVDNPVNEAKPMLIPIECQQPLGKITIEVGKCRFKRHKETFRGGDSERLYKQIASRKAYFEIRVPHNYLKEFENDSEGLGDELWTKQVLFPEITFLDDEKPLGEIFYDTEGKAFFKYGEVETLDGVWEFPYPVELLYEVTKIMEDLNYGFDKLGLEVEKIKPDDKELLEKKRKKYRPEFYKFYLKEKSDFIEQNYESHEGAASYLVGMVKYSIPQPRLLLDLIEAYNRAMKDAYAATLTLIIDSVFFFLSGGSWLLSKIRPPVGAAAQTVREAGNEVLAEGAQHTGERAGASVGSEAAQRVGAEATQELAERKVAAETAERVAVEAENKVTQLIREFADAQIKEQNIKTAEKVLALNLDGIVTQATNARELAKKFRETAKVIQEAGKDATEFLQKAASEEAAEQVYRAQAKEIEEQLTKTAGEFAQAQIKTKAQEDALKAATKESADRLAEYNATKGAFDRAREEAAQRAGAGAAGEAGPRASPSTAGEATGQVGQQATPRPGLPSQTPVGTLEGIKKKLYDALICVMKFFNWVGSKVIKPFFDIKSTQNNAFSGSLVQWGMDYGAKIVTVESLNPNMDWIDPSLAENNEEYMKKDHREEEKARLLDKAVEEIRQSTKKVPRAFCECLMENLEKAVNYAINREFGDRGKLVETRAKRFTYNFLNLIKEEYKADERSSSYLGWNPSTIWNLNETWRDFESAIDWGCFVLAWGLRIKAFLLAYPTAGVSLGLMAAADLVDATKSGIILLSACLGDSLSKERMMYVVANFPGLVLIWIKGCDDKGRCEDYPYTLNSLSEWWESLKNIIPSGDLQPLKNVLLQRKITRFDEPPEWPHINEI